MKIAVLISGGVDSSVALRLLQQHKDYNLTAFYLKIWLEDELAYLGDCPWEQDLTFVRDVCKQAQVPLHVVSLQKEYHDRVVSYTIDTIKTGGTPNPDVLCNTYVKFGAFYDTIGKNFDAIATGHYANVIHDNGAWYLERTPDDIKDQTYFLANLSQQQLSRLIFPLALYTKTEIRAFAHTFNLPNKDRKDSQGLCFLGKIKFHDFVKHHMGEQTGDLIEYETGEKKGTHNGFWFYTIGQRQGIGLSHGPWYVVSKNIDTNTVLISRHYYSEDKKRNSFTIDQENWFSGSPCINKQLSIKLRHGASLVAGTVHEDNGRRWVQLAQDDQGIAYGQFAVFYDGLRCLGSARIGVTL